MPRHEAVIADLNGVNLWDDVVTTWGRGQRAEATLRELRSTPRGLDLGLYYGTCSLVTVS